jgi:hypothetical protein
MRNDLEKTETYYSSKAEANTSQVFLASPSTSLSYLNKTKTIKNWTSLQRYFTTLYCSFTSVFGKLKIFINPLNEPPKQKFSF